MNSQLTKLSDFLIEREERIKHEAANKLRLKRIKKIDFSGTIHLDDQTVTKTDMVRVKSGNLVISGINAAKGAVGVYRGDEDVLATIHYSSYKFDPDRISIEFLKWFFKSAEFSDLLKAQVPGGIKTELKPKHILPLQVKIPKLSEQKIIADKLNRFERKQATLEAEITHQRSLLAKLKQAILQEAIQGKLTADWRAANPDVEPTSQLLHRIRAEKTRLIAEKKFRKEKPLPAIAPEEIPFQIPKTWQWCRFASLGIVNPKNLAPDDREVSFVRMSAIPSEFSGKITPERRLWRDVKFGYTHIANGDVALAKITPCFENGKATLFRNLTNSIGAGTTELHVLRPILVIADYLLVFLKSPSFVKAGIPKMTGTAGQKRVPTEYFTNALTPLAPLTEQSAIVERVESLMKMCSALEAEIEHSRAQGAHLLQAVLKEAFNSA